MEKLVQAGLMEPRANPNADYFLIIDFEATCEEKNPPGYPQQNQAPGAPFAYAPPAGPPGPGAMAYPPPPSNQNFSEKDLLRLNEGPPPYFPQGKYHRAGQKI